MESEYPESVKACNALFLNNIGNHTILSKQATNLTRISSDLAPVNCGIFPAFTRFFVIICAIVFFLACLALRADMTDWVHLIEFCQELFVVGSLNIVREPCLSEYHFALQSTFMIFRTRLNLLRNTNYLKRIFVFSCYFLENIAETTIAASVIFFIYLLVITVHMFLSGSPIQDQRFKRFLRFFEFGIFIRLGQVLVMPFTYFAMLGLRVVVFDSTTKIFDYLLALLYCVLLPAFVAFSMYIINYAPVNLEAPKTLAKYGSFYAHVRFQRESKVITNEFFLRQVLKMLVAAIHHFSYFNSSAVCLTAIFGYGSFLLYILITFYFNGMYRDLYMTFKMSMFHLVIMANYIFAIAQVTRTSYELNVISFLIRLMNSLMILYLILSIAFFLVLHIQQMRNQQASEFDEEDKSVNLNVAKTHPGLHQHGDLQAGRAAGLGRR